MYALPLKTQFFSHIFHIYRVASERLNDIKKITFRNTCFFNFLLFYFLFFFRVIQSFNGHPIYVHNETGRGKLFRPVSLLGLSYLIHRPRNNASSSSCSRRCVTRSPRLPHLSTVFFSLRPSSQRRALFRARFMKWYFVQFHFSVRLDLLAPGSPYSETFHEKRRTTSRFYSDVQRLKISRGDASGDVCFTKLVNAIADAGDFRHFEWATKRLIQVWIICSK